MTKPTPPSRHAPGAILVSVALAAAACDARGEIQGGGGPTLTGCPTTPEAWQTQLFEPTCGAAGCHAGPTPAMGLDLVSAGLVDRLVGVPANGCGDKTLIVPGAAAQSYLFEKVSLSSPTCGEHMPLGMGSLTDTQLSCLSAWLQSLPPPSGGADAGSDAGMTTSDAATGPACPVGQTLCGADCVDLTSSGSNCGSCGHVCAGVCSASRCVQMCPPGTTNCSGSCVDLQSSASSCGACGQACPAGKSCVAGACTCGPPISFAGQVQPIFTAGCTSGCHSGMHPAASLSLVTGSAIASLVNVPSSSCSQRLRVSPGMADQSYLMNKLTGTNLCSGSQMPKTGGALSASALDLISGWICEGAPNN